jgi:hypothetical protein
MRRDGTVGRLGGSKAYLATLMVPRLGRRCGVGRASHLRPGNRGAVGRVSRVSTHATNLERGNRGAEYPQIAQPRTTYHGQNLRRPEPKLGTPRIGSGQYWAAQSNDGLLDRNPKGIKSLRHVAHAESRRTTADGWVNTQP